MTAPRAPITGGAHQPRHPYRVGPDRRLVPADDDRHLADLVRLVLLTGPRERLHRPEFGPGLGATALFEPLSDALPGLIEMRAKGALEQALGDRIVVEQVVAEPSASRGAESTLVVRVAYRPRLRPGPTVTITVAMGG
ncbi:GPW/gp25 family protein [Geodermatophilus sp. SYSU D00691]